MKTTPFLIIFLNFLSKIVYSWPPLLMELHRWEASGYILASDISPSQGSLFLSVQTIDSNKILIFNTIEKESRPALIAQIEKDSPVYFIFASGNNGKNLILASISTTNSSTIMEIWDIKDISNSTLASSIIFVNRIIEVICLSYECDLIGVNSNSTLEFFSIKNSKNPERVNRTAFGLNFFAMKNYTVLIIIGRSSVFRQNMSNQNEIREITKDLSVSSVVAGGPLNANTFCFHVCVNPRNSFFSLYDVSENRYYLSNFNGYDSCKPGKNDENTQRIKAMENEFYYYKTDMSTFWYRNIKSNEQLFFNNLNLISDVHLLRNSPDYKIFIYDKYFSIMKKVLIDTSLIPYSISEIQLGAYKINGDYKYTFDSSIAIGSSFEVFNLTDPRNPKNVGVNLGGEFHPNCSNCFPWYSSMGVLGSKESNYLLVYFDEHAELGAATHNILFKAYFTQNYTEKYISIYNCYDRKIVLKPNIRGKAFNDIFYINMYGSCNIFMFDWLNGEMKSTNIKGSPYSVMDSCKRENTSYLFVLDSEFYFKIYSIKNLTNPIKSILLVERDITHMTLSSDCTTAYMVGKRITIINLKEFASASVFTSIYFPRRILWVAVAQNSQRLYLDCGPFFYTLNIQNLTNPFIIKAIKKNQSVGERENLIYSKNLENFIYLLGGDFLVENSSYYFLNLDANKIPQVGIEISFMYVTVDLTSGVIGTEVIQEMYLISVSATRTPLKQPLPSWIKFNGSTNFFTMTIPKTYQYENLHLLIEYQGGIHEQIMTFLCANQTLLFNALKKEISSPTSQNIEINIKLYEPQSIKFLSLNFGGVFINYDQIFGYLAATGSVQSINSMLQKLKYKIDNFSLNSAYLFNLTIIDYINFDLSIPNISISIFHQNNPPKCHDNLLENFLKSEITTFLPLVRSEIQLQEKWFFDEDNDTLTFSLKLAGELNNTEWLFLSSSQLKFYGTPQSANEDNYSIEVSVTDGFETISRFIDFEVFNHPPIVNIPLKSQLKTKEVVVGENFMFYVGSNTFIDPDNGPFKILAFSCFATNSTSTRFSLTENSDFWLRFNPQNLLLYGSPTTNDISGNDLKVEVQAFDGTKNCSDFINFTVKPSLVLSGQKDITGFPYINSFPNTKEITGTFTNQNGKIILFKSFVSYVKEYKRINDSRTIRIVTNPSIMQEAFSYLVFRDNLPKRVLLDPSNSDIIDVQLEDSLNQQLNFSLNKSLLKNNSQLIKLNQSLEDYHKFVIIGEGFGFRFLKPFFVDLPSMSFNCSYNMTDLDKKPVQEWLLMIDQNEYLEFYRSTPVEESLKGKYHLNLNITDEFQQFLEIRIFLDVDHTDLHYVLENLKLFASIVGPIFSILAGITYYNYLYNLNWRNQSKKTDQVVYKNEKFIIQIPLIGDEIKIAQNIASDLSIKEFKHLSKIFLSPEFSLTVEERFLEKLDLNIPERTKDTVCSLFEGFVIRRIMDTTSHARVLFEMLEKKIKHHNKTLIDENEWFTVFFEKADDIQDYQKELIPMSFVIQKGIFLITEKDLYFRKEFFDKCFNEVLKSYKKSSMIEKEQETLLKNLIMRCLVSCYRGIPFKRYNCIYRFMDWILVLISIKFLPYLNGNSLHIVEGSSLICVSYFSPKNRVQLQPLQRTMPSNFFSWLKFLYKLKPLIKPNGIKFPNWLKIKIKNRILNIKGTPPPDELQSFYYIEARTVKNLVALRFRIVISSEKGHFGKRVSHGKTDNKSIANIILTTGDLESKRNLMSKNSI